MTVRSPLRLRLILSGITAPLVAVAAVVLGLVAAAGGAPRAGYVATAIIAGVVAVISVADLVVLRCRRAGNYRTSNCGIAAAPGARSASGPPRTQG
jgi:hypothetical protein